MKRSAQFFRPVEENRDTPANRISARFLGCWFYRRASTESKESRKKREGGGQAACVRRRRKR